MLNEIREKRPLVLCLTNYVTADFVANALLTIGASPIVTEFVEDVEDLIKISDAIYINIGTPSDNFIKVVKLAVEIAKKNNKPIIFDPVASGSTKIRTALAKELASFANVIRGNASEICSLSDETIRTKGVDSSISTNMAKESAIMLAKTLRNIVVISGKEDFITDGINHSFILEGNEIMSKITGMGCSLTAVIAAFCAIESDFFEAANQAVSYFGKCGQKVKDISPGKFKVSFIDALWGEDEI